MTRRGNRGIISGAVPAEVERLKRVLLSLPELGLRTGWLRDLLANQAIAEQASLLNGLCEDSERGEPQAREAMLVVALVFAAQGECEHLEQLRQFAEIRHLLSLGRLLRKAPPLSVRPPPEPPIPDYGTGRELTVGERKSLARTPNRRAFEKLLRDPHPLVLRQLLGNPRLTENDVLRLAARRPARREVLESIAQHGHWLARTRVRMAVLLNPGTPAAMSMPLLAVCNRNELQDVLQNTDSSSVLRNAALELLERLPPLGESFEVMQ